MRKLDLVFLIGVVMAQLVLSGAAYLVHGRQAQRFNEIDRVAQVLREQGVALDEITLIKAMTPEGVVSRMISLMEKEVERSWRFATNFG
jgi:hypothetical protein